jgi:hypothetical protein
MMQALLCNHQMMSPFLSLPFLFYVVCENTESGPISSYGYRYLVCLFLSEKQNVGFRGGFCCIRMLFRVEQSLSQSFLTINIKLFIKQTYICGISERIILLFDQIGRESVSLLCILLTTPLNQFRILYEVQELFLSSSTI